jgi:hypothetical protein
MTNRVWKYPIPMVGRTFTLTMPKGASWLFTREQDGDGCMWFAVDDAQGDERRTFFRKGTGDELAPPNNNGARTYYRGSFFVDGGALVWHIFEQVTA